MDAALKEYQTDWLAKHSASKDFPLIGRRQYLSYLSAAACDLNSRSINVIVAPKDNGKSRGLVYAMKNWAKLGHLVVDIDLKGRALSLVMKETATAVGQQLSELPNAQKAAFHAAIKDDVTISLPFGVREWAIIAVISSGPYIFMAGLIVNALCCEGKQRRSLGFWLGVGGLVSAGLFMALGGTSLLEVFDPSHRVLLHFS